MLAARASPMNIAPTVSFFVTLRFIRPLPFHCRASIAADRLGRSRLSKGVGSQEGLLKTYTYGTCVRTLPILVAYHPIGSACRRGGGRSKSLVLAERGVSGRHVQLP